MSKRIVVILLVLAMAISLGACSGNQKSSTSVGTTSKTDKSQTENSQKKSADSSAVEIEFWYGLGGKLGEVMATTIDTFNNMQDKIFIKGVKQASYSETDKMLQAAIASGDMPDCYLTTHHTQTTFARKELMQYLDEYITKDPKFDKDDIIPSFLDYCTDKDGKVYSLPVWGTTQVVYYRKDMFEEVGLDPDEVFSTWQNVAEASRKLQEHYKDVDNFYGFEPMSGTDCLNDMAYSNGGSIISEDQRTITFAEPEYIEAWEAARKWINEDKIMGIHFGGEGWEFWYKTIDDVMEGRAAGYVGSSGDQGDLDFNIIAAHVQPGFGEHSPSPYVDPITVGILAGADEEKKQDSFTWITYLNKVATCDFSMATGYVPVRSSARENPAYKEHLEKNPQALVPLKQAEIGRKQWYDFTGGKVSQALADAADLVEIENVPAKQALKDARDVAQEALDEYWKEEDAAN